MKTKKDDDDVLRQKTTAFFDRAGTLNELTKTSFAAFTSCPMSTASALFTTAEWKLLQDQWLKRRLLIIMDEVYGEATIRKQFSVGRIIKKTASLRIVRAKPVGITRERFTRLVGYEWAAKAATLPTRKEFEPELRRIVLWELNEMVKEGVKITIDRLLERARKKLPPGVDIRVGKWLTVPFRASLLECSKKTNLTPIPAHGDVREFASGWVSLDADEWDLRCDKGSILRRSRLRPDLADVAWSILRDELRGKELATRTVCRHHNGFVLAGELLGTEVPDVRAATLESFQRAWHSYQGTGPQRRSARLALKHLFAHLFSLEAESSSFLKASSDSVVTSEMLRIFKWIESFTLTKQRNPEEYFLSEDEMDMLFEGCLTDIKEGLDFVKRYPYWISMSTLSAAETNSSPVVRWIVAAMILLMAATGLRRQSLLQIKINDWIELSPGLFALAWRHDKSGHEDVAAVPSPVIEVLQELAGHTKQLRDLLETDRLFLTGDVHGNWRTHTDGKTQIGFRLKSFVERHRLIRAGIPVRLNPSIIRRTYATRMLYQGVSLSAVQAQFGHAELRTTIRYVKGDQYEHPAYVGASLDRYGHAALTTWHRPVILEDLTPEERVEILADRRSRDQEVGLCRWSGCSKVERGGPPPCYLCEHLVTGPEFLGNWLDEHSRLSNDLQKLSADPATLHIRQERAIQLRHFEKNLKFVQERCEG